MRTLLALAAERNWEVHHVDIDAAYLIAVMDEEIYMEIPTGIREQREDLQHKYPNYPKEE
jgi:hypothetical protein